MKKIFKKIKKTVKNLANEQYEAIREGIRDISEGDIVSGLANIANSPVGWGYPQYSGAPSAWIYENRDKLREKLSEALMGKDPIDEAIHKEKSEEVPQGIDFEQLWDLVMRQKELYQEELYPASIEAAKSTSRDFFEYLSEMTDIANIRNIQKAWTMNYALADLTDIANRFYREQAFKGNIWGMAQASLLNTWMQSEIDKANEAISEIWDESIEEALPGIRQTASTYKAAIDKMLSGEIPDDVIEQTRIAVAEAGLSQGRFGQALEYTTARNLGLTSLQLQQQGMAQMPALIETMHSLRAPYLMPQVSMPQIRTDVTYLPQPQFPTAQYVSPHDPAALQQVYLSGLMQTAIVPPSSYAQALTTQYQTQLEYAYAKEMSALNYQMFQEQMRFAKQQRWWDLAGTIGGIGLGLGLGGLFGGLGGLFNRR